MDYKDEITGHACGKPDQIEYNNKKIEGNYHKFSHDVFTDKEGNNYFRLFKEDSKRTSRVHWEKFENLPQDMEEQDPMDDNYLW